MNYKMVKTLIVFTRRTSVFSYHFNIESRLLGRLEKIVSCRKEGDHEFGEFDEAEKIICASETKHYEYTEEDLFWRIAKLREAQFDEVSEMEGLKEPENKRIQNKYNKMLEKVEIVGIANTRDKFDAFLVVIDNM